MISSKEFKVKKVSCNEEWEQAYAVRLKVFVEEQKVPQENELDDLDAECIHWIVFKENGQAVGTLRLYIDKMYPTKGKLGRMAVLKEYRRHGIGRMLVQELVEFAKQANLEKITCHAQEYIQNFYKSCGFTVETQEIFMEEGIPHVLMSKIIQG